MLPQSGLWGPLGTRPAYSQVTYKGRTDELSFSCLHDYTGNIPTMLALCSMLARALFNMLKCYAGLIRPSLILPATPNTAIPVHMYNYLRRVKVTCIEKALSINIRAKTPSGGVKLRHE